MVYAKQDDSKSITKKALLPPLVYIECIEPTQIQNRT